MCVDYRKLNSLTVENSYPIPRISDILDSLSGSKYFCTLDLRSGYYQVAMNKESFDETLGRLKCVLSACLLYTSPSPRD